MHPLLNRDLAVALAADAVRAAAEPHRIPRTRRRPIVGRRRRPATA
jgi:hypothetical protein